MAEKTENKDKAEGVTKHHATHMTETKDVIDTKTAFEVEDTTKAAAEKKDKTFKIQLAIIVVLGILLIYNLAGSRAAPALTGGISSTSSPLAKEIISQGVPPIYGTELGVNFDDVSPDNQRAADATIRKLGSLDTTIQLSGKDMARYITIASQISCEYCCWANSIIFTKEDEAAVDQKIQAAISAGQITAAQAAQYKRPAGEAACGCAHSFAMRGLAKYLITEHGAEYTDEQILGELGKWKVLFFPGVHLQKAQALKDKGIELNYVNLASNKYRGIETGKDPGQMVGGC
ncbi:hypothetical protein HY497_00335 [Candidatus Woesearchaeota archaeon]|nr:hypothetical protein [Candidatus Woesearchaeota archaeon]